MFSPHAALQLPSPHWQLTQSAPQLCGVSPQEQAPSPQTGLQSEGQLPQVSPALHVPLPQQEQSLGQVVHDSPASHAPLPHWHAQSCGQVPHDSLPSHTALPQVLH